jgi:hypothetical protein
MIDDLSKKTTNLRGKQLGFTMTKIVMVVTIAVVAGIGALLLQGFFERARVAESIDSLNAATAAVFAYQDRYGRTPGDDGPAATLAARGAGWEGVIAGDVSGKLDVGINQVFSGTGESGPFWQQLKAANFISGDQSISGQQALPENPWGGLISVLGEPMGGDLEGIKVCLSQVPGSAAISIDNAMDDGDGATGRLRATIGSEGANTTPSNTVLSGAYTESDIYTLCYSL